MHLTPQQESLISQHLRDAARQLDARAPAAAREHRLRELQTRIYRELEGLNRGRLSDEDVRAVLRRAGGAPTPEAASGANKPGGAQRTSPSTGPRNPLPAEPALEPVWLGVCAFNADRISLEPWIVRTTAVVFGLLTGPIAILCYLAAYVEYYFAMDPRDRPRIAYSVLALRSVAPFLVLVLLRWGAGRLEALIGYAHERLVQAPLPPLGDWDWLPYYESTFFYLAFLSVIPLGILSGLPMANAWGHSLKRLAQAIVALYGVLLCFGLASILVGVILDRVDVYMQ